MSGTKQLRSRQQRDVPTSRVRFRVVDLRVRHQTTNLGHMRPYCVLRLGDKHHRTASFLPEGLGPVPARRTTSDDGQQSVPDAGDAGSSGVSWEIPTSWTDAPCDGISCHRSLGPGWNRQRKAIQKKEGLRRGGKCTEMMLEIYDQIDLDSGRPFGDFRPELVGVVRVKLCDMLAHHRVNTRGDRAQVAHEHAAVKLPDGKSHRRPGALPNAETCASLTRCVGHRRERWVGGVSSPAFCSRYGPRRDSPASGVIVEARLEITWDGCGFERPHRSVLPVFDSFGQAVVPRNVRKCFSAQNLWTELREPLQRAQWSSEAGRAAWATFRASRMPIKDTDGSQDWQSELRGLVWHGVPSKLREGVYMSMSGASSKRELFGSGHYEALVSKCRSLQDEICDPDVARKRDHERENSPPDGAGRSKSAEEAMPAETSRVEPTSSVDPESSTFYLQPFCCTVNSKVYRRFPRGNTASDDSDHYSSSSDSGADHSLQGSGLGDDQGDSSSAGRKPHTSQSERLHQENEGTPAETAQAAGDRTRKHAREVWREIEADLDRVFTNGRARVNNSVGMASMRRVLRAYSLHNRAVGYCQGMNFIAGLLLEIVPEESAFWLLAAFCEDLHPGYHTKSMIGARSDIAALKDIIRCELPRLHARASEVNMPLEIKLTQWLLVGFINCFPPSTALRILEVSFLEGSDVYLATALSFLRLHEEEILRGEDIADVVCTIDRAQSGMYEADILLTQVRRELTMTGNAIRAARELHRDRLIAQEDEASSQKRERGSSWFRSVPELLSGPVGALLSALTKKAVAVTQSLLVDGKLARPAFVPFVVEGVRWLLGWKAVES